MSEGRAAVRPSQVRPRVGEGKADTDRSVSTRGPCSLQREQFGGPGGGSRTAGEWVQEGITGKALDTAGLDDPLEDGHLAERQRLGPGRRTRGQGAPRASVRGGRAPRFND